VLDNSNDYLGMAIETDLDKANIKWYYV
jgi:hypothetical protein